MQCSFETQAKLSKSGVSAPPMSPELKKCSSEGTGQDKGKRSSMYLGLTLFTVCCVWEILMVFLATFMPAADVEICIGMIGVPLSLFLLSKKNCGVSTPISCKNHKVSKTKFDPYPSKQTQKKKKKKEKKFKRRRRKRKRRKRKSTVMQNRALRKAHVLRHSEMGW